MNEIASSGHNWDRLKPGASFVGVRVPNTWTIADAFPTPISREMDQERSSWEASSCPYAMPALQMVALSALSLMVPDNAGLYIFKNIYFFNMHFIFLLERQT